MRPDTTLLCADCGGELGMLVVMRGYLRLGHKHAPATIHPPRIAPASRGQVDLQAFGLGEDGRLGPGAPDRTRAHGAPPQTARRAQETSSPLGSRARLTPRRAVPAPGGLPEPSAGKGSR